MTTVEQPPTRAVAEGDPGDHDPTAQRERLLALLLDQPGAQFPTTYAQRRQWLLHRLAPDSAAYAMPLAVRLRGPLDADALQAALDDVTARHEGLRTTFPAPDGRPVQQVHPDGRITLSRHDLTGAAEVPGGALAAEVARPFDLAAGPLVRVVLWRLGAGDHVLLVVAHHIVADGWSVGLLLRDLAVAYRERSAGRVPDLPALPVQPADYAVWEAAQLTTDALAPDLEYWRAEFADPPRPLDLPTEQPRTRGIAAPAATRRAVLDAELTGRIRAFARAYGCTDFVVLLTGYGALLHRFTGQDDLVVGTPVSGRIRRETADLVGCFVNTLPVRLRWPAGTTVAAQLDAVRERVRQTLDHQRVPLDLLVDQVTTSGAGTAPFDAVFALQEAPRLAGLPGLAAEPIDLDVPAAKFDLTCIVEDRGDTLCAQWEYRADLLDAATVDALAAGFEAVLRGMLAEPGSALSALPAGRATELVSPPGPGATVTVPDLFAARAAATPQRVAVHDGDTALTYADLDRRGNRLAHALRAAGVGPEVPVGIHLPRSADFALAALAVVKAGGYYVPLNPEQPVDRLRYMATDSRVRLVLTRGGHAGAFADLARELAVDDPAAVAGQPDTPVEVPRFPDALCLAIYTSGSTGRPKGVGITHRGVVDLVLPGDYCGFGPDATLLWISSVSFDVATWEMWGTLLHGATGVVCPERAYAPVDLRRLIQRYGVTTALLTPALFNAVVDEDVTALAGLRWLLSGGEALSVAHVRAARAALPGTRIVNAYGPAEITTLASVHPVGDDEELSATVPIGLPIAGTRMLVAGPDGRPVPDGAVGELWLSGSGLARGYLGKPRLTAERFVPAPDGQRWYRTGDASRRPGGGPVVFRGRLDNQVKVRGHRVEPGEVEAVLTEQPEVARAVVVPRWFGPADCRLAAYLVPAGPALDVTGLRAALRRLLPDYLVPAYLTVVDALPVTPNGKVDLAALPEPDTRTADEAPADRTPEQDVIAALWADLLHVDAATIAPDDDFFALGGQSLLAAALVSRVRTTLGVEVPLAEVFAGATLAEFADAVARHGSPDTQQLQAPVVERAPRPAPLSYAQQRLWFLAQLDPDSAEYNIPLGARIHGPLDVAAMAGAVRWLVERHEVLRTVVEERPDGYVQRVLPMDEVPALEVRDVPAAADPAVAGRAVLDSVAAQPFALTAGELPVRAVLVRVAADEHLLGLVVHHIMADGWSVGVMADELSHAYAAYATGATPDRAPLELQYADLAYRELRQVTGESRAAEAEHWHRALAGVPHVLDLPTNRPRPARRRADGAVLPFALGTDLSRRVRDLALASGCTGYMVLLAAFAATLGRYSGQDDFLVGTTVANRPDPAAEALVGFFANTVPLRMRLDADPRVTDLLARVRGTCLEAFSHPGYPFERLVEELAPARDLSRSPLVQVMFSFDNTPAARVRLPGLAVEPLVLANPVARFDLTLALRESAEGIEGICEYDSALFDAPGIGALLDHLRDTLAAFAAAPNSALSTAHPAPASAEPARTPSSAASAVPERGADAAGESGDQPDLRDPDSPGVDEGGPIHADGSVLRRMLRDGWQPRDGQAVVVPARSLSTSLVERLLAAGARITQTVTVPGVAGPLVSEPLATADGIGIGYPVAGLAVRVVDTQLRDLPVGARGELLVAGTTVAGDPVPDGGGRRWVRSGRTGHLDAAGRLHLHEPAEVPLAVRGERFEAVEVEAALRTHPAVADAAALVRDDRLLCYVSGSDLPEPARLAEHARTLLPDRQVPDAIVALTTLPRTPSGAVDRAALAALPAPETPSDNAGPRDDLEAAVAAVWAQVLDRPGDIDVHADFFALGGHSFLAARIASRLSRAHHVDLGARVMFENPTIAGLAAWIRAQQTGPATAAPTTLVPPTDAVRGPLSFPQERLWFLAQYAPESPAYNLPIVARLGGPLHRGALREALRWTVRRHASLRTRFATEAGQPIQTVLPGDEAVPSLVERDFSARFDAESAARRAVDEHAYRPFALTEGELPLRALLVRVGPDDHLLAVTVHHLVADGWAVGLLVADLCRAYEAYRTGRAPDLPAAPRYLDYAIEQRRTAGDGRLAAGLDFWRKTLAGAPTSLDLPADHPRPATRRYHGASLPVAVPAELTARVRTLAQQTGCSEFMVLFAAFATVLARFSGQPDLLIGTPVANRPDVATEALVGLLANTVALRADLRGDPTVRALLARVRDGLLDAFAHQDTPFEKVVEHLAPERDSSRSPLFQVMLALNNAPAPRLDLADLTCEPVEPANPTAKFDIVLNLADQHGDLTGLCEYDTDVYSATMVGSLLTHLVATLDAFTADPDRRLSDLDTLTPAEHDTLIERFNRTPARYEHRTTLHALVERAVDADPDAAAVVAGDAEPLTYRALDAAANRLAWRLIGHGIRPDDVVGVYAHRSTDLVVAHYAVLKAGATILPIDPAWPAARTTMVLTDAGARVALAAIPPEPGQIPDGLPVLPVDHPGGRSGRSDRPAVAVGPGHGAYIVYTSGSTGRPKGVLVEHAAIANNLLWMQQDWPLAAGDRLLHKTANTFDVAVKEVFWPLLAGATLVLADPGSQRDPQALLEQLDRHAITITHFVPSMLDMLLDLCDQRRRPLGTSLRYLMCGAETLSVATQRRFFAACGADLLHMYGPTETAIAVTGWTCVRGQAPAGRVPLGRPMPNSALYVLDRDLRPVPAQVWGELYVGGAPLARGYLGRPVETATAFRPDPFSAVPGARMYRTGDVVRHGPDGLLEFRGRRDGQVKVRGFRVELGEIEAALRGHPAVAQAAVVVRGSAQAQAHLVAYVVADRAEVDGDGLRGYLAERLPAQLVPAAVVLLDALPLNENGKVDRRALPDDVRVGRATDAGYLAPRDDLEREVADAWERVLGVSPVGVHDDFFALGGHSLQAAQIVAQLRERFDREVPLREVFAAPTVATVARLLREAPESAPLPRIRRRGAGTPPPAEHPAAPTTPVLEG